MAAAVKTELVQTDGKWQLLRDGKPYFIKGVGGDASKTMLAEVGGNSYRTWGADNLDARLDEAQRLGLTVAVGIWLEHERHGFDYSDEKFVAKQFERAKKTIERYKDHPAVLMWGIGNEMEGYKEGDDPRIWHAVEQIAAMAKQVDPNHPTMTVTAEIGAQRVASINRYCPSIDIHGINSYGGIASIAQRYMAAGGTKPYVMTEFGPVGTWEVGKNKFNALVEPTSTQKGEMYRRGYESAIASRPLCLGGFAFTWGAKQEATATWFGMLLPDGTKLAAVEVMSELWGKPMTNHVPRIEPITLEPGDQVTPGASVTATVKVIDPDGDPIKIEWQLHRDTEKLGVGGDREDPTKQFPDAIERSTDESRVEVTIPPRDGVYRIYAIARDGHGNGATANAPILAGDRPGSLQTATSAPATTKPVASPTTTAAAPTALPLIIYSEGGMPAPYAASGWMGNQSAIKFDDKCTTNPHSGKTCMKAQYTAGDNFAGIVWQDPPNDWGDVPGGRDLSGAKKLSFWARGEKGGEKVEFKYGVLPADKKFADSSSGATTVELTKDWKQYEIDLAGKDLSKIKTGFCWVVAGQGEPVTFYLDDVEYE
jgi:hypothetical protein